MSEIEQTHDPLLADLAARGLISQQSDAAGLAAHLAEGPQVLYCGFDPTAPSLQVGNLVPLLALRRFQLAGHKPILLLGGATGLIGDPSGKSAERNLNDDSVVAGWVDRIRAQVEPFLDMEGDFDGPNGAIIVNNLEWTSAHSVVYFLREIGKHFSVNMMMQRESVKARLEREGEGISYTEFSYMLLQAMDFYELAERHNCTVQIGGNDQWGNIVSGVDLVRRKLARESFGLTLPLITKADGTKFGKTAEHAVWLAPDRTSPYAFYQFWLNSADADVVHFLNVFTLLPLETIEGLALSLAEEPQKRAGQQALAAAVTELVHGAEAVASSQRITAALFGGEIASLTALDLSQLQQDGMDSTELALESSAAGVGLLSILVESGLAASNGAARKLIQGGGVRVNGEQQTDVERQLRPQDGLYGRYFLLRKGKKNWYLVHILK